MKIKRMLTAIASVMMTLYSIAPISAVAADPTTLQNKLTDAVRTDSWISTYHVFPDAETEYPYLQCEAYIYADGVLEVYFYNSKRWSDDEHLIEDAGAEYRIYTVSSVVPIKDNDLLLRMIDSNGYYFNQNSGIEYVLDDIYMDAVKDLDFNTYPADYTMTFNKKPSEHPRYSDSIVKGARYGFSIADNGVVYRIDSRWTEDPNFDERYTEYDWKFGTIESIVMGDYVKGGSSGVSMFRFEPNTGKFIEGSEYRFHIFGHDITVSWNSLNGESYAKDLEDRVRVAEASAANYKEKYEAVKSDYDRLKADVDASVNWESKYYDLLNGFGTLQKKYDELVWDHQVSTGLAEQLNKYKAIVHDRDVQIENLKAEIENMKSDQYGNLPAPDLNGDGYVTMSDVVWLCRFLAEEDPES